MLPAEELRRRAQLQPPSIAAHNLALCDFLDSRKRAEFREFLEKYLEPYNVLSSTGGLAGGSAAGSAGGSASAGGSGVPLTRSSSAASSGKEKKQQQQQPQQQQQTGGGKKGGNASSTTSSTPTPPLPPTAIMTRFTHIPSVSAAYGVYNLALVLNETDPQQSWNLACAVLLSSESIPPPLLRNVCALVLHQFTRAGVSTLGASPPKAHASRAVRRALTCLSQSLSSSSSSSSHPGSGRSELSPEEENTWRCLLWLYAKRFEMLFEKSGGSSTTNSSSSPSGTAISPTLTSLIGPISRPASVESKFPLQTSLVEAFFLPSPAQESALAAVVERSGDDSRARAAALNNLASGHFRAGRFAASLLLLSRALGEGVHERDPLFSAALHANLGRTLMGLGDFKRAYEALAVASACEPASAGLWLHLAECCSRLCCPEGEDPTWPVSRGGGIDARPPRLDRGWLDRGLEAADNCLIALQETQALSPPLSPVRVTARKSALSATAPSAASPAPPPGGSEDEDQAALAQEAAREPASKPNSPAASTWHARRGGEPGGGDTTRARALLVKAYLYAVGNQPAGSLSAAFGALALASHLSPLQQARALSYAAEASCRLGRPSEGVAFAAKARAVLQNVGGHSLSGAEVAWARTNLGAAACTRGRFLEAEREFHAALQYRPGSPSAFRNLLFLYLKTGRPVAAQQVLLTRRAMPLAPGSFGTGAGGGPAYASVT